MPERTKPTPVLLPHFLTLLAAHRSAFRQERTYRQLVVLAVGLLCAFSRHTLTQVLVALGLGDHDWSAAYRLFSTPRLALDELYRCFLRQTLPHVPEDQPYLVALDGVQVPRRSWRMPGTSWLHDPHSPPFRRGIHRAHRFSHLAWLTPPTPLGFARAIPLRWRAAFPEKAVRAADLGMAKEWEAGLAQLTWLREALDAAGRRAQAILAVADGAYSNQYLWQALPAGVQLLARCAQNRALYGLPPQARGRGRPRNYGQRAPTPQTWLEERGGWTTTRLAVRGRAVPCTYRVAGPYLVRGAPDQPLFLLVVRGLDRVRQGHRRRRQPAYWLVSAVRRADGNWATPYDAAQLLGWAWQRWEIEVTHRELKCGFGVGESQCWNPTATVLSVQWRVWVWSVLVLSAYQVWGLGRAVKPEAGEAAAAEAPQGCPVPPLGRWWAGGQRWSFGQLWQAVRQELWELHAFPQEVRRIVVNVPEKGVWVPALAAAALGARRG